MALENYLNFHVGIVSSNKRLLSEGGRRKGQSWGRSHDLKFLFRRLFVENGWAKVTV